MAMALHRAANAAHTSVAQEIILEGLWYTAGLRAGRGLQCDSPGLVVEDGVGALPDPLDPGIHRRDGVVASHRVERRRAVRTR